MHRHSVPHSALHFTYIDPLTHRCPQRPRVLGHDLWIGLQWYPTEVENVNMSKLDHKNMHIIKFSCFDRKRYSPNFSRSHFTLNFRYTHSTSNSDPPDDMVELRQYWHTDFDHTERGNRRKTSGIFNNAGIQKRAWQTSRLLLAFLSICTLCFHAVWLDLFYANHEFMEK